MRPLSSVVTILVLILVAGCQPSESQSLDGALAPDRIIENLKLEVPQLRQAQRLTLSTPEASAVDGFQQATLTINGANQMSVLISDDGEQLLVLAAPPVDVSRSMDEVSAELDAETTERTERFAQLAEMLPTYGPSDAPVTVTVFSEFQCPYCAQTLPLINDIKSTYPERVRLVFAHFPLPMHGWARPASIAAQCAARQRSDAFWAVHDAYFEQQSSITEANVIATAETALADAALDLEQWRTCASDEQSTAHQEAASTVDEAMRVGESMQVRGTPTFFINGEVMRGPRTIEAFGQRIEAAADAAP